MSHQALFTSLLSLDQPLLTSLAKSTPTSPACTSPSPSTTSTAHSRSRRRPSISSSSSSSSSSSDDHILHPPIPYQQRKRKYEDNDEISGDTPTNKKLRRQQQNRQAAHTSRIKKKAQMDALQQQVADLIEANRILREKVTSLQSEVETNRALVMSSSSPSITDSPASSSITSSPDTPISPMLKSPLSPLSESDTSMDLPLSTMDVSTSQIVSEPTSHIDTSITHILAEPTPDTSIPSMPSTPSCHDLIPSTIRCYNPAVIALSPPCQPMMNGMNIMTTTTPAMTWEQFTVIVCILHTVWMITNTFRMNQRIISSMTSSHKIISTTSTSHLIPSIQPHSISLPTSRMSGNEISTLGTMIMLMALSRGISPTMKVS